MTKSTPAASGRARAVRAGRTAKLPTKATAHWRLTFLASLAETSNVSAASACAGVHPSRPYKVRREEPDFARLWHDALCEGYDNLEMEVLHRLRFGEPKAEADRRFDNAAALRQLTLHRETVSRQRALRDHADLTAVRASIERKLIEMRAQIAARAAECDQDA